MKAQALAADGWISAAIETHYSKIGFFFRL
jgi:hypothetical protein